MNIVIVGLGVIGGSFALALKEAGYADVWGIDSDAQTLEKARALGVIRPDSHSAQALLPKADIAILALYPDQVAPFLRAHARLFRPGAILTDVTGVKRALIADIGGALPPGVDFIPGHPMAGREKKGIDFASASVFQGANYLITPLKTNDEANIRKIEDLVRSLGFKRVTRVDPATHDRMIAFVSQLPHALAVALINSDEAGRDTAAFIGDSYRDLTRIANINASLWSELFLCNREYLLEAIGAFERELIRIKAALVSCERAALVERFEESSRRRERLENSGGKRTR